MLSLWRVRFCSNQLLGGKIKTRRTSGKIDASIWPASGAGKTQANQFHIPSGCRWAPWTEVSRRGPSWSRASCRHWPMRRPPRGRMRPVRASPHLRRPCWPWFHPISATAEAQLLAMTWRTWWRSADAAVAARTWHWSVPWLTACGCGAGCPGCAAEVSVWLSGVMWNSGRAPTPNPTLIHRDCDRPCAMANRDCCCRRTSLD